MLKPRTSVSCLLSLLFFFSLATTASSAGYEEARTAFTKKDYKEARSQCQTDAETNPKCQNLLAAIYVNGLGVSKNPTLALEYWEKSVAAGFYKAYGNLARQLLLGRGVPANAMRGNRLADEAFRRAQIEGDNAYIAAISKWMVKFHRKSKTGDSSLVGKWKERLNAARKR